MVLALAFFWWLGRSYTSNRVRKTQATFEGIIQFLSDLAVGTIGPRGEAFVPVFVGIFLFIWILNEFGVHFIKALGLPFGGVVTTGVAVVVAVAVAEAVGIGPVSTGPPGHCGPVVSLGTPDTDASAAGTPSDRRPGFT